MRQLTSLDAQFLNVESPTTVGHVGSLVVLDPSTAPDGQWTLETVRAVFEPRLHLAAPLRQRLVPVPLGLGRPYWVDDPHFDIEFHLRELALPAPGTKEQLGEQVARIHARQLDRTRPLWEAYVITGLEGGKSAFYTKIHHAAIDGVSGAEILETIMDITVEPREVEPEPEPFVPRKIPSTANLVRRGLAAVAVNPVEVLRTVPKSLGYLDELPGAANFPGARLVSETAGLVGRALGHSTPDVGHRALHAPRTPLNGHITPHRRFSYGSVPLSDVKRVKNHFGLTVNDVVMTLTAAALRRWLLDHDALPTTPLVVAVPVSIRTEDQAGAPGNLVSVMMAELPTHLADPAERLQSMKESMEEAKRHFDAVPATLLQDLAHVIPTALSGLAARALFKLAMVPGVLFNLFVSNVPGPQLPLYIAGAKVEGVYPVSAVTDMTGGLNITLFSYDGDLDFGLIACREMVPDVWNLIGYLQDAMAELVALVPGEGTRAEPEEAAERETAARKAPAKQAATGKTPARKAPTKKAAEKAAAKKTPAKKAAARKTPAKQAPAKKAPAKKAPAEKAAARKSAGASSAGRGGARTSAAKKSAPRKTTTTRSEPRER
ncbi:wax ester/triacylglycerol synthase family O-acyltransferase [Nocardioides sp. WL0053]|uniref:Diacylglycerol O-acyltransferase n=1 Tax=Nocardioides jiangsuensis TaxID=2866161 RepID=A0ABS7RKM2_9ACTN|nr:wax ester/triacylglycerol synthase family O-acyltransferase [Nocardioides jiangsuensis]MBY9075296.1 wax ester/triacylglycerol synthase family O-acyltransferase [Nocardioides jiangsuensis]